MQNLVRKTIVESVHGVLTDPDYGLEVSDDTAKRLKKYSTKSSKKRISLKDLQKKYS